jgi:dsRNA-specific ribonuclease
VKEVFVKYFPDVNITTTSTTNSDSEWLENVLENLRSQIVSNKSTSNIANNLTNNHLNSNCSDNFNNKPMNGDSSNSSKASSIAAENELVLLENAQLKSKVEDYKNIIADTVSLILSKVFVEFNNKLKNLIFYEFRKAC